MVRAPAGYRLRIDLLVVEVDAPRSITFTVTGDIAGRSQVRVDPEGEGSRVALTWSLRPDRPLLRALSLVARPVLVRGHDRILDDGLARCCAATGLDLTEVSPR